MFTLKIKKIRVDSESCGDCKKDEVVRILTHLSERVRVGDTEGKVYDVNGNSVGNWELE